MAIPFEMETDAAHIIGRGQAASLMHVDMFYNREGLDRRCFPVYRTVTTRSGFSP